MPMPVLTEEAKAKTKWCPMSRVIHGTTVDGHDVAANSFGDGVRSLATMCLGSGCMMWRFGQTHIRNPNAPDGDLIPSADTHGYCGLAGVPGTVRP